MKIVRNIATRTTPIALPGRSVHLARSGDLKGRDEAPIADHEADEAAVLGLKRSKAIRVRDATDADKAKYPTFDETKTPEFVACKRRREQLARAATRAAGGVA